MGHLFRLLGALWSLLEASWSPLLALLEPLARRLRPLARRLRLPRGPEARILERVGVFRGFRGFERAVSFAKPLSRHRDFFV